MPNTELRNIAVFIDYENFGQHDTFDTRKLIDKLKERGRLIIKRAYADWGRFSGAKRAMLENSVDLIEIPTRTKGKNAADIRLVVDALETAITKDYIDTIVVVSGDSDYTPLISKLREYNKYVIVVGGRKQTSRLLVGYCDELIFYSNLIGEKSVEGGNIQAAYDLLSRAIASLEDQGIEVRSSQLKPYMKQLDATFDESNYGFPQFKRFLQQAAQDQIVALEEIDHGNHLIKLTTTNHTSSSELPPKQLKGPNKPVKSPHETHDPKLLDLIYWAFKINEADLETGIMLGSLAQTIKTYLEPDFDITAFGYTRGKGFKGVVEDLQNYGYVSVTQNPEKNQHIVSLKRPFLEYGRTSAPPANYQQLRLESRLARLGMTANMPQITLFMKEARRIWEAAANNGRLLTLQELYDEVRSFLQEQDQHVPYKRVVNTILQSGSLQDIDGRTLQALSDDQPLGPFPADNVIIQRCAIHLKNSLLAARNNEG